MKVESVNEKKKGIMTLPVYGVRQNARGERLLNPLDPKVSKNIEYFWKKVERAPATSKDLEWRRSYSQDIVKKFKVIK